VNLKSHHRRLRVVVRFRRDVVRLNSPGGYDYCGPEVAQARIACAVMRTRPGLNGPTAARMTLALWDCED
jgi:hypothetical protein